LIKSEAEVDMRYYSWFDEQAGQLRFNFINSNHKNLPFKSEVQLVESESSIIKGFLASNYHDGIAWSELEEVESIENQGEDKTQYHIKVYMEILRKRNNS